MIKSHKGIIKFRVSPVMGNKLQGKKPDLQYLEELHKRVPNMKLEDVMAIYEDFRKNSNRSGKLTKDNFRKVYKEAFGRSVKEFADAIFKSFDTDGNGTIDFEEFLVGLSLSDATGTDRHSRIQKLRWAFNVYDKDRSGTIDKTEMVSIVKAVFRISSIPDVLPNETPESFADKLFNSVDENGDGEITFDEFVKAAEEDDTIVDLLLPAPKENNQT